MLSLIGSYLGSIGLSMQADICDNAVQKVLQVAKPTWKPGQAMTARLKEALYISKPGRRNASQQDTHILDAALC